VSRLESKSQLLVRGSAVVRKNLDKRVKPPKKTGLTCYSPKVIA
jgi:hypothetical protein